MPQLDAFRFFAVAVVMFGHWTMDIPSLARFNSIAASAGVDLFFVLSGFLITQILMKSKEESGLSRYLYIFYVRRFLRIFPLYYAVIFVCVMLKVPNSRVYFYWLITYTTNFPAAFYVGALGYMLHLWSLAVEEQFYIFFPFIIYFVSRKHFIRVFAVLAAVAVVFRAALFAWHTSDLQINWAAFALTPGCLDCFSAGAILAYLKVYHIDTLKKILKLWYMPAISIAAFLLVSFQDQFFLYIVFSRLFFAVFAFWIIGAGGLSLYKGLFAKIIESRALVYLGKISYGIYVYHHFMPWVFSHVHIPHQRLLYFPATILLSALSWQFFELPINNLKRYFEYNRQSNKPTTTLAIK